MIPNASTPRHKMEQNGTKPVRYNHRQRKSEPLLAGNTKKVENKIEEIKKTYATLDAKKILIKSKLLAISKNAAQTYPPPANKINLINEKVKNCAV